MNDHITAEMTMAAYDACAGSEAESYVGTDLAREMIADALDVAPTVNRLLAYFPGKTADTDRAWACWAITNLVGTDENGWVATLAGDCEVLDCPGPHRSLLLGPVIDWKATP